jgi:hypothetical protein
MLQPAVSANTAAEVKTGRFGEIASKHPADTGATTPVLFDQYHFDKTGSVTHSLDSAADVPQAVPLMDVPNVSGVIPSDLVRVAHMYRS